MNKLQLYYFDGCPYCRKVINFLESENIAVTYKNIHIDAEANKELQRIGGKNQVPCLFINGKPLYESDDIIAWVKANRDKIS